MNDMPSMTEAVILAILANGERFGRQVRDEYRARTRRSMPIGSLYVTLERMEQRGYVRSRMGEASEKRGGNRRKYFRLTAEGHRVSERVSIAILTRSRAAPGARLGPLSLIAGGIHV